ncbi:MAG: FecR domain-containing protein [Spirochaetes bacterium]|nr:FecR domain-containing protein [Spirochaetota bacterium]
MKMKYFIGIGLLLILFTVNSYAISVKFMLGDVSVIRQGNKSKVTMKSQFQDGDLIVTGDKSYIVLTTEKGDEIKLQKSSKLLIDLKLMESGSASLINGSISAKYNKIIKTEERKIYTPTAVAAVRGTEFEIIVSDDGTSRVEMIEGSLDVYNPNGKVNISGKEKSDIAPGGKPSETMDNLSQEDWIEQQNAEFNEDPESTIDDYEKHIDSIKKDSDKSKDIKKMQKDLKNVKDKSTAEKSEKEINAAEESLIDNLMLNRSSSQAIENILQSYQDENNRMSDEFERLKNDLDKVKEQQERDLAEIKKIKEEYLKMKKQIFEEHDSLVNQILENTK